MLLELTLLVDIELAQGKTAVVIPPEIFVSTELTLGQY